MTLNKHAFQKCISSVCGKQFDVGQVLTACPECNSLLDVKYDWNQLEIPSRLGDFERFWANRNKPARLSGVWRFHQLLPFASLDSLVTIGEGQTILQQADRLANEIGLTAGHLHLQYEGFNPSGSFKDNGMTAALTHARNVGAKRAACASTGNTSASLAMFAAATGLFQAIIFVGSGKIAYGKLSQALDFGAVTIQIEGDFDDAMARVKEACPQLDIYLVNSVNPFRLEGQKTIMLRVLESLDWQVPDWIVVPGGNLGSSSAFGKAFSELHELGLIVRIPRVAAGNAEGASTLDQIYNQMQLKWDSGKFDRRTAQKYFRELQDSNSHANTIASAIEINLPVNLSKCLRALEVCNGVVLSVSDEDIMNAKALIAKNGFGCEPASAASVAGVQQLRDLGTIQADENVVCILTGHQLKDPTATVGYHTDENWRIEKGIQQASFANAPIEVGNNVAEIVAAIEKQLA